MYICRYLPISRDSLTRMIASGFFSRTKQLLEMSRTIFSRNFAEKFTVESTRNKLRIFFNHQKLYWKDNAMVSKSSRIFPNSNFQYCGVTIPQCWKHRGVTTPRCRKHHGVGSFQIQQTPQKIDKFWNGLRTSLMEPEGAVWWQTTETILFRKPIVF